MLGKYKINKKIIIPVKNERDLEIIKMEYYK